LSAGGRASHRKFRETKVRSRGGQCRLSILKMTLPPLLTASSLAPCEMQDHRNDAL